MNPLRSTLLLVLSLSAAGVADARSFLADGGGIRSERPVRSSFNRIEPSRQHMSRDVGWRSDGGFRSKPFGRHGSRDRGGRFVDEGRSFTRLRDGGSRYDNGARYDWPRSSGNISVIQINTPPAVDPALAGPFFDEVPYDSGPKIIDVASARLDRRPYGPSGLDIVYSGTTKIIRIAPGYRRGGSAEKDETFLPKAERSTEFAALTPKEQAVTVYPDGPLDAAPAGPTMPNPATIPVPSPAPEDGRQASRASEPTPASVPAAPPAVAGTSFEPWTAEWLRDCVARYPNFDASLGTYADETGRRRFCTGEP